MILQVNKWTSNNSKVEIINPNPTIELVSIFKSGQTKPPSFPNQKSQLPQHFNLQKLPSAPEGNENRTGKRENKKATSFV